MPDSVAGGAISANLTYDCDLRCAYCLRDASPDKCGAGREMPFELFCEIVRYAQGVGYRDIWITGGETTLYPRLFELLEYLDQLGFHPLIETNGRRRSPELIDQILARCRPSRMLTSLDSVDPAIHDRLRGQGSHEAALVTLRHLVERGQSVLVNAMVVPETFNSEAEVVEFVEYVRQLGARQLVFSRVVGSGRGLHDRRWTLLPEKMLWLRALIDRYNRWDGFVGHLLGYQDTRPAGGTEHAWSCGRLASHELSLSPAGFHPCIFQHGVVLAPLTEYREFILGRTHRQLDALRTASMIGDAERRTLYSCPECVGNMRQLLGTVQQLRLNEVELGAGAEDQVEGGSWSPTSAAGAGRETTALAAAGRGPAISGRAALARRGVSGGSVSERLPADRPFPTPNDLLVFINQGCNSACNYCHFDSPAVGRQLPLPLLEKLLQQAQFLGLKTVRYNGGEPLLYDEFEALLRLTRRHGFSACFISNGLAFADREPLLRQYRDAVDVFWIGLDGATAATHEGIRRTPGSFDQALYAIRTARAMGLRVGVQLVALPDNVHEVEAWLQRLVELGVPMARIVKLTEHGRARTLGVRRLDPAGELTLRQTLARRMDLVRCFTHFESSYGRTVKGDGHCAHLALCPINVDWDGRVYPCPLAIGHAQDWKLPSLAQQDLYECLHQVGQMAGRFLGERLASYPHHRPGDTYAFCEYCIERYDAADAGAQFSVPGGVVAG